MESNNLLPEFSIEPSDVNFIAKPVDDFVLIKTKPTLSIEEIKLQQAKNNGIKVQSVSLPKRITDPNSNHKDLNDWFASMPIPREYPMDVIPPAYILELGNGRLFDNL